MVRTGRSKAELILTSEERERLGRWTRRRKLSRALVLRFRIVLACGGGMLNKDVAVLVGCAASVVTKWWSRFVEARLDGLVDEPCPGRPAMITADQVEDVVVATPESTPANATHWLQPAFPRLPGMPEKRAHDYFRHGTTSLFATMNMQNGTVITSTHHRHRAIKLKNFPQKTNQQIPEHLDIHMVCDNDDTHKHPTVTAWVQKHPRLHIHFTPTHSSGTNQVKHLLTEITRDLLQRPNHHSVQALEKDLLD